MCVRVKPTQSSTFAPMVTRGEVGVGVSETGEAIREHNYHERHGVTILYT